MATSRIRKTSGRDYSTFNEIVAVILIALAVLIFLCLITHSPNDWSFNTASSQKTQNWIGVVGAVISDLLFQTVGFSAYFLPALLAVAAWRFFSARMLPTSKIRIAGYCMLIVSLASMTQLFGFHGGIVGAFIKQVFASLLGLIGAGIILTVFFLTSLLLITNFSISSFFSDFELARENFQIRFGDYFVWYKKWREARNQAAIERLDKRNRIREEIETENPAVLLTDSNLDKANRGR